jgi:hypothetical protein
VVDVQSEESIAAANLDPVEVVIAGEVIEHLDAPGPFLRGLHPLVADGGVLALTTPNAHRLLSFLAPLTGAEYIHGDHTGWHSPQTLRTLLHHSGWHVEDIAYYHTPLRSVPAHLRSSKRFTAHVANQARGLLTLLRGPLRYWSEGIIVWARPTPGRSGASAPQLARRPWSRA